MFAEWRKQAGLPDDLHAHGLRKAFCRVAAEAGMTPHEIMSLSGHKTLGEVIANRRGGPQEAGRQRHGEDQTVNRDWKPEWKPEAKAKEIQCE